MKAENGSDRRDMRQRDLDYLRDRVREEADAAAAASSMAVTLVHLSLATAYAKRCCAQPGWTSGADERLWADEHRIW